MSAITAVGLRKTYGSGDDEVEAVRGVDLEVADGEVFGFLGPNGAGKSTTIRMLTTLMTLTAGTAYVAGIDVSEDPDGARRRIGVALQEAGLDVVRPGARSSPSRRGCSACRRPRPLTGRPNCSNSSISSMPPTGG